MVPWLPAAASKTAKLFSTRPSGTWQMGIEHIKLKKVKGIPIPSSRMSVTILFVKKDVASNPFLLKLNCWVFGGQCRVQRSVAKPLVVRYAPWSHAKQTLRCSHRMPGKDDDQPSKKLLGFELVLSQHFANRSDIVFASVFFRPKMPTCISSFVGWVKSIASLWPLYASWLVYYDIYYII